MPYKNAADKRRNDKDYWLRVKKKGPPSVSAAMNRAMNVVQHITVPKRLQHKHGLKIAWIPDVQAMHGVAMDHLPACSKFLVEKRPDVIVLGGDFGDFPSLSRFDRGTRKFEGLRYKKDIDAYHCAMELFMTPLAKAAGYNPLLEYVEGNHESHLDRVTQEFAFLEGWIDKKRDLHPETYGWRFHDFMQPIAIGGVAFCHYFPSGVMGRPITSAQALLTKLHMSCVAGHQPGRDIAYGKRADGQQMTALITGSFYQHDMEHLSPFTNSHFRGMYMLHEVKDGSFAEMAITIDYLKRKFG